MRLLNAQRRRYRPRLFWWLNAEDIGSAAVLVFLIWLFVYVLPRGAAHNVADDLRTRLREIGFVTVEN